MEILATLARKSVKRLAAYLNQPYARYVPLLTTDIDKLARVLLPGDVILVDGNTRFAALVKYLTQSTWSHVAMYVGPLGEGADPPCIVEADIENGVRGIPLSELRGMHVRAVRATGLADRERASVARRVASRVGQGYDFDCAVDLARSLWPLQSSNLDRRRQLSAAPDRAICSTLLAHAFEEMGYPILPAMERPAVDMTSPCARRIHTPRDFDLSPFFAVVPPVAPQLVGLRPSSNNGVCANDGLEASTCLSVRQPAIQE